MTYNILPSGSSPSQPKQAFKPADIDLKQPLDSAPIRTIPELIEYNARANPDALYCVQALRQKDGQPAKVSQVTMC